MSIDALSKHINRKRIRRFLFIFILFACLFYVFNSLDEVQQVAQSLQQGNWRWMLLATAVHILWLLSNGWCFQSLYKLLGINESIHRLALLSISANFVNIVAPSAGIGGMAIFLDDAQRKNHKIGRVTTAAALFVLFDYFAILFFVALGLTALFRRNQLNGGEIIASIVLAVLAIFLSFILLLAMKSEHNVGRVLAWIADKVNRLVGIFSKRQVIHPARAHEFAADISEGLQQVRQQPWGLVKPILLAILNKSLLVCLLALVFLAFGQPITAGTLIGSFSIGYLFLIISPTPSGLGFVEGAMSLALNTLRVPLTRAVVMTLAYRGITFWLSLIYGLIAFRFIDALSSTPVSSQLPKKTTK